MSALNDGIIVITVIVPLPREWAHEWVGGWGRREIHLPLKPKGFPNEEQERHMRQGSGKNKSINKPMPLNVTIFCVAILYQFKCTKYPSFRENFIVIMLQKKQTSLFAHLEYKIKWHFLVHKTALRKGVTLEIWQVKKVKKILQNAVYHNTKQYCQNIAIISYGDLFFFFF